MKFRNIEEIEAFLSKQHYSAQGLAKVLEVDPQTLMSWLDKDGWEYYKVGNRIRIPKSTVRDILLKIEWRKGRARYGNN